MSLQNFAEQYFSKLNPTARRLYADINDTKAAYDKLWTSLSEDEKDQIVNESIIKPEVCIQYSSVKCDKRNTNGYGLKTIVDDNYSYQDEHSAPFSFRTASQQDLTVFNHFKVALVTPQRKERFTKKEETIESCDINELSPITNTSPVPILPKTGLDLLDNW